MGLNLFWEMMAESWSLHGQALEFLCGGKAGKRSFPERWHVQCGSGPETAAKRTPDKGSFRKLLGIERDLREESRGHQEGVREGICGASQDSPGRKLWDRLRAICSHHSQNTKRVLLVTPVDSQVVLNTAVWKP